ncbi:MAG TPA: hypothetical protein EYG68_03285 [Leucothrix mucor]|nr:hypothetical protein [Leucothrix mucor]
MKFISLITVSSIALAGMMSTAQATDFSYNYVEGGYSKYNIEEVDSAFGVAGSYGVTENINVIGSYSKANFDTDNSSVDASLNQFSLGVGYHTEIAPQTDILADVSFVNMEVEASKGGISISGSESGYGLGLGVRHQVTDSIEGNARVSYTSIDDESDTALSVGGRYNINEAMSAGVDLTTVTDKGPEIITTSLRWNFL